MKENYVDIGCKLDPLASVPRKRKIITLGQCVQKIKDKISNFQ